MSEALTFAEKEPASGRGVIDPTQSERKSGGPDAVGTEEPYIRWSQEVIEEHQTQSGRTGRRGPVRMVSGRMALGDAKSGRDVDLTLRPDSRLAFRRPGRQTHGAHRTQGIIFADAIAKPI